MREELRCYTFTNFMLSSIQQGIQSGHASMELVNKYIIEPTTLDEFGFMVSEWAFNHKTIVCLNGGNADDIRSWKALFDLGMQKGMNTLPYAGFFEDEKSLDGNLTSVAVILPARIFEGAAALRRAKYDEKVSVTLDHLSKELRIGWIDNDFDSLQHTHTYNMWERDLMNKLNGAQLAR